MQYRHILNLEIDSFFVSVERSCDPSLGHRPVVIGGSRGSTGVVAAASAEARRAGVLVGMSLAQAEHRCPDAAFLQGSFGRYLEVWTRLDEIIRRRSRVVEWVAIDEVYVEGHPARPGLWGSRGDAEDHRHDIGEELGLDLSCGVASSKVVARIAAQLARPRGLLYVLPGYEARFLAPVRVELLPGLGGSDLGRLRALGIETLGELGDLEPELLIRTLGHAGRVLARLARGIDERQVQADQPPRQIREELSGELPEASDELAVRVADLVNRAVARLGTGCLMARIITVSVEPQHGASRSHAISRREPTAARAELERAVCESLARIQQPGERLRRLTLCLTGLVWGVRQAWPLPFSSRFDQCGHSNRPDRVRESRSIWPDRRVSSW